MNVSDIFYFIQGNLRYKLFYSKFAKLIPKHIREQIEHRIANMDPQCYEEGQCIHCGCSTTALQMCNKACGKPCYPEMMDFLTWETYKTEQLTLNGFNYEMEKK